MAVGRNIHPMSSSKRRIIRRFGLFSVVSRHVKEKHSVGDRVFLFVNENKCSRGVLDLGKLGLSLRLSWRSAHVIAHRVAALAKNIRPVIDGRPISRAVINRGTPGVGKETPVL